MLPGLDQLQQITAVVDPLPGQLDMIAARMTNMMLTIGDVAVMNGLPSGDGVVEAAAEVVKDNGNRGGFFGPVANFLEACLKVLDSNLSALHVPYSYGFSIILLTMAVKLATFPLTKKQVESTMAMQVLQPRIKDVQSKFKNDQEKMQLEVARIYKESGVNPLAGCLPTLATLPVWIGLYRALSNVADEGLLQEGFFWIPSLAGPTTLALQKSGGGFSWLVPLTDGVPPVGWAHALAYLSLPVMLVASQFLSQKIISPPASADPQQQQSQAILKFLPFMIGYFALNVPSGLALYWFVNNILSTAQQVYLKSSYKPTFSLETVDTQAAAVDRLSPPKQKKVKDITGQQLNSRRSAFIDVSSEVSNGASSGQGEKFRALKAREAAKKAGQVAGSTVVGEAKKTTQEEKKDDTDKN